MSGVQRYRQMSHWLIALMLLDSLIFVRMTVLPLDLQDSDRCLLRYDVTYYPIGSMIMLTCFWQ
ncbi:hypothetical protein BDW75DRAFT_73098 [Aspergillus navahoensis]